ncbi:L,D-transpeptidase family protein [Methylobacter sp. YRD-M1]|uniref:L,D-transpeptidase family protein n=1 Tax=Methylobacter sp. YRD-M1 TaxID=2911520 RepID=UPI00227A6C90|nr:L,D-transpeptidase family protein [Methylobacter sp. YRD-M1]WAK01944.1 L,D-transpeptidase family protein [Methylobacter sp. YRD-M1]
MTYLTTSLIPKRRLMPSFMPRLVVLLLLISSLPASATTYELPDNPGDSLIGDPSASELYTTATHEDTLLDIARRYDMGQLEILLLNPDVDRWLPGQGTRVRLPSQRLLPDTPRKGLILNLPEYRMYYFPRNAEGGSGIVKTFPHSIGRVDWRTPLGRTTIIRKTENPTWIPPASIRAEHAADGDILPEIVPAGPDNPLGMFAMYLGTKGYLIHGTNKPFGVGMRVSHGCIRMYPEDIEELYPEIETGMPVSIVNQPVKVGWHQDTLYIEVHPTMAETEAEDENGTIPKQTEKKYLARLELALKLIERANNNQMPVLDGAALKKALQMHNGIPVAIYKRPPMTEAGQMPSSIP